MAELPSGTVTFLFTDIEGSTARWEHQAEAMRVALARHDALIRAAIVEHGGHVVRTVGDTFHAAFSRAPDALAAAIDAQRSLQAESWGELGPLRVRMALHTGAAEERDGNYYGPPLNRVARLLGAGHGGQVLLSQTTYDLIQDAAPEGAILVDLGEHRLKDLIRPERVYQLVAPDLTIEFPPLRSLDARPHNLPIQTTPLLGREREVEDARYRLLRNDVRLLTLTGPGGTGKTRLALQVAADLVDQFPDGVFFVALAPISAPDLVPAAIAQVLQLRDVGGHPILGTLKEYLRNRALLLVLDNFEQILSAAPVVAELLSASQGLKVLVTSRSPLALRGEHELHVPPLALPDLLRPATLDDLSQYAAVALFVERAAAIKSDFALTDGNAPAVAEICVRLDGLPLAIELAAARARLLSPQAMLARLDRRLPLLTGGARDLPERQRTLRDTIAWSYELLTESEQRLFRRLSIFVGGCTLESAEVVSSDEDVLEPDTLDGMASLVAKSLVQEADGPNGERRLVMLETIREFAFERLEASGEAPALRRRHAKYFLTLAEQAWPRLDGVDSSTWLDRLQADHDNLRAVLAWSMTEEDGADMLPALAGYLWTFWWMRGYWSEANGWLDRALEMTSAPAVRYRLLTGAGRIAQSQSDLPRAKAMMSEAVDLTRAIEDDTNHALALGRLGYVVSAMGDHDRARALCHQSLALSRRLGDCEILARSLQNVGHAAHARGDDDEAVAAWTESLQIDRAAGSSIQVPHTLQLLAIIAGRRGEYDRALAFCNEALDLFRQRGDVWGVEVTLTRLGRIYQLMGSLDRVAMVATEGLPLARQLGNPIHLVRLVGQMAWVARSRGDPERSTRLLGATQVLRDAQGRTDPTVELGEHEAELALLRAALGDNAFEAAWAAGRAMSLDQAYDLAAEITARPAAAAPATDTGAAQLLPAPGLLSRREREVVLLVAEGLNNPQIAGRLGLSDRTVDAHLRNIMGKLDVTSRAQVAAWSVRHGLTAARPGGS